MSMKSAYEIALERLAEQGVDPPSQNALSDEVREAMREARSKAEASLAEIEILHRDELKRILDPTAVAAAEERYSEERRRIEARRDREIDDLRAGN